MKTPLINLILENDIPSVENVICNFSSSVIPNVGDTIVVSKLSDPVRVERKIIDYRQVDGYSDEDDGRGAELVYLIVSA